MGAWSESITGNDTAEDLLYEYPAAFLKYEPEEALSKIDQYVRENEFDESEPEEWCNYVYSLADYMWKKGILTDKVKERAIQMIDSGFGLDIWAESGEKMLKARKRVLSKFREKLTSPMPPKKKIKLEYNPSAAAAYKDEVRELEGALYNARLNALDIFFIIKSTI